MVLVDEVGIADTFRRRASIADSAHPQECGSLVHWTATVILRYAAAQGILAR